MKIGVISDLHIDMNERKLAPGASYDRLLAELLYNNEVDLLLLAGDISSDYHDSLAFLDKMKRHRSSPIVFVPGNHDFWSIRNKEEDTREIYRIFREREESPVGRPLLLGDEWAVVGNPGWYDYGFADNKRYTLEQFEAKKLDVGGWNDRLYINWHQSDREVANEMLEEIHQDLDRVGERKVILMTHVVTHPLFTVPLPNRIYDYYNAFLGNKSYMRLYEQYPIEKSIMGHVHMRRTLRERGVTYYCACLGNARHWWTDDPYTEMAYTLETFLLPT